MKVANLYGPLDIRTEDWPLPVPVREQVLVKIRASGICGSDINSYTGRTYEGTFPYVPGHEWSGEVEQVGDAVATLRKGDKVTGETVVGCGNCDKCKAGVNPNFCRSPTVYGFQTRAPGGFAQYVLRDERNLSKLPPAMTHDQGALVEPLSVAYHAVWGLAGGVQSTETVVVFGAGPVGLFALSVVKGSRARAIAIDPIEMRRDLALRLGADHVVDPLREDVTQQVLRLTGGHGADLVLEASGNDDARSRLFDVADGSGRVVMIGQTQMKRIPMEMEKLVVKGLTVRGAQGSPGMFQRTIDFLEHSPADLTLMISHHFPLEKTKEALDLASQRTGSVKVVLTD
ncbi:MAG: alcohol dehydrogenase catalytic domain-containing protein [Nitrososphaerota archaeon]|nr:alcohol dehydrogenase catalytic domain-containing protein [Nitrososphaerota archaeon]